MKILITGGGCEEPIDEVRSICNFSTGRTASAIISHFCEKGHDVTALLALHAVKPESHRNLTVRNFRTFSNLHELLKEECSSKKYDMVIHAAAVSDYSPEFIEIDGKEYPSATISKISSEKSVIIKLKQNPKLVNYIKEWTGKNCFVVAFKLTTHASISEKEKAVNKIFSSVKEDFAPDVVVSNDISEIAGDLHPCRIYSRKKCIDTCNNISELSTLLEKYLNTSKVQ